MRFRFFQSVVLSIAFIPASALVAGTASAADAPSAVGPVMNLLKSGRLPAARLGNVVEIVCHRGNAHDLAYVYEQATKPDGYEGELRLKVLDGLADAARTRKVKPAADLAGIAALIDAETSDRPTQFAAIRLAGIWNVKPAAKQLQRIAASDASDAKLRQAAIDALVEIGGASAAATFQELAEAKHPQSVRYLGAAALAGIDLAQAAPLAAQILADGSETDEPMPMLDAFLERQGGADRLAEAIAASPPPKDVARVALRYMYSIGRTDPSLVAALSKAADINPNPPPPTAEEVRAIVEEVLAKGDPARGEQIFRRGDLSCMKCHSVSKAGGQVGPDLSPVGSSSPVDYLVNSILQPSLAIKEAFITKVVITVDGKVYQGIAADRTDDRLVLKDANGKRVEIPTADIDDEAEGRSLMPTGLTQFLTHGELIDLVAFLAQLGKPGEYAVRTTPTLQRWRVLKPVPDDLANAVPDETAFELKVLKSDPADWTPAYAMVAGKLPLEPLVKETGSDVLYLSGEVDVTVDGPVGVHLDSADGVHVWIDGQPFGSTASAATELPRGRHRITLRIDTAKRGSPFVRAELFKPEGSGAEFGTVDGM